ncbi:MAG: imidazolonepropionase [Flavobacterium sp.]|nr:imidazolonepropionase [Flavobacterium sp.]
MLTLLKNPAQIVTVDTHGKQLKKGDEMNSLEILTDHNIVIEDALIKDILPAGKTAKKKFDVVIDLTGKSVLPGLIDCHTHTAFAGSRANEFRLKLKGATYEEIAKSGGGINNTVQSIRKSSFEELVKIIRPRVNYFISQGVTTLEIKSGYGLSFYDEIKLLQVINFFKNESKIDIIPTFLAAHTIPPEYKNDPSKYVSIIIEEMLPFIAEKGLAIFCDAFCEKTAFSASQVDQIFTAAKEKGFALKLHSEQFNSIGGVDIAIKHKVTSIDHLEVISDGDLEKLVKTDIVSVLLPGVSFFLGYEFAPARKIIDNGGIVALSTDYNPGSSHIANLNLIMSLACLKMKMTVEETISTVTINAAKALKVEHETGSIEAGKKADFAIFDTSDYSDIVYNVGKNLNCMTIKNGEIIYKSNEE